MWPPEKSGGAGGVCGKLWVHRSPALGLARCCPCGGWSRVKATGAGACGLSGAGESSKTFHRLCSSGATQWPVP